ncbi:intersectin-2-like [Stegastes partitus]|uniref:Intersectin-2-like n=2 Tax=Stegastes partitus TaxID=144197 RepID=A0A9Y4K8D8_9TELE|nr:PREDICTED: intersectin-2-like [Stegastes partitus]
MVLLDSRAPELETPISSAPPRLLDRFLPLPEPQCPPGCGSPPLFYRNSNERGFDVCEFLWWFCAGGSGVWAITAEERGKHDKQFDSLGPVLGHVSGEQARKFFLQSGLPPAVLAEIWNLADLEGDGKMDRLEFSIAMKLIKLKLQGRSLPSALPGVMKQLPPSGGGSGGAASARLGMGSMPNLSVGLSSMSSILTPIPANPGLQPPVQPLLHHPLGQPLGPPLGPSGLHNGSLLTPPPAPNSAALPLSGFSSPMTFSPSSGMSKANSLLDLGSSSSNSSSTTSLASNSPKMGSSDWAVPQASRLKYRQQFNTLDKLMSGYLSGESLAHSLTLADVDKDGQLRADEFILAMHLVDMAKTGRPLPLTLPQDLVPPSLRGGMKSSELVNGTGPYITPCLIDTVEVEPAQKNKSSVSFEDKLKENFARGSAELEKRRLALEEEQRKEKERREREEREAVERREREAREQENRRRLEEERRLERQREMERQREEERLRELERKEAAKQELERQRREEWELRRREELGRRREGEQEEISRLRAKKKSLELELEAVGNRHKQISDRLRDAQSKRRIHKAEVELVNQKRDARIAEINSLQLQFEDWQRKLSQLVPEQQKLTEKLRSIGTNKVSASTLSSLSSNVTEKSFSCRRLKDQLDLLEQETTDKLAQMEQYNQELQFGDLDDCVLRGLLSLLACLTQLFLLIKELREKQVKQQSVLDDLHRVKEEKLKELQRRREEERERRRREEEEAARQAKLEQERRQREEEEARQRRLQEEEEARQRRLLEEQKEAQERLRAAQQEAQEEEERRRREEEEKKKRREVEEQKEAEEEERKRRKEEQGGLTSYRALYSFIARNADELSIDADCLIQVDENTVGEPGWLCGSYRGNRGWFPHTYAEKCAPASANQTAASSPGKTSRLPPPLNARGPDVEEPGEHTAPVQSDASEPSSVALLVRAVSSWSASSETRPGVSCGPGDVITALLSFSAGDVISVLQQREDWWLGQLNGTQGWFPKSYVAVETGSEYELDAVDSPDGVQLEEYVALYTYESPEAGDLTFVEGDVVMVTEREGEWWRGCIGDQTGVFPSNYVRPVEPEPELCQVIAMYDYAAANQDELSFSKGQLINILDKTNPDWWKGEAGGVTGLLPTNYVKMTTESDPSQQLWLTVFSDIPALVVGQILEHTPEVHADRSPLREALERAEELCSQVNEGVREKENSDRLEWIQSHVQCEGPIEHLVFNSLTNCLGPRKLLHSGRLYKTKSSRELWAFLFNDFLLLTHGAKPFSSSGSDKLFSPKTSIQLKMYKTPLFLNEVLVKMPPDPSSDEPIFHVSHIDRVYTLKTETLNERTAWVQKIKAASEHFIETEKKKREKAYQARSLKTSGIGRLLVTVTEAQELKACKPNGKSNPYCELTMGAQCYTSRPASDTLSPKWNFNCQFFIKDLYQDVLCITVFEKDQFSPDDFLGRTEVPVATIKKEMESKGAATRRLLLHEVPTGEVWVRLDLQLYEPSK